MGRGSDVVELELGKFPHRDPAEIGFELDQLLRDEESPRLTCALAGQTLNSLTKRSYFECNLHECHDDLLMAVEQKYPY